MQYQDTNLQNGTTYYYKVLAKNAVGDGPLSTYYSDTTFDVPSAPTTTVPSRGIRQLIINWTTPLSDGESKLLYYEVFEANILIYTTTGSSVHTYTHTGLINNTTYSYTVRAVNAVGNGVISNIAVQTTYDVPSIPLALKAVAQLSSAALTWNAPTTNGGQAVLYYNYYFAGILTGTVVLRTITDYDLPMGGTRVYAISAVNLVGEGPSATVTATSIGVVGAPSIQDMRDWYGTSIAQLSDDAVTESILMSIEYVKTYLQSNNTPASGNCFGIAVKYYSGANLSRALDIRGIKPNSLNLTDFGMGSDVNNSIKNMEDMGMSAMKNCVKTYNLSKGASVYIRQNRSGRGM